MKFLRSVLLTAAAAEAPTSGAPAITIPKLSELTKGGGAAGPPAGTAPNATPPEPPKPPTPPPTPPPNDPTIDTQIVKPRGAQEHTPAPAKTPADFARERHETKARQESQTLEEANRRADEALQLYNQRQTEFEQLQEKQKTIEQQLEELKGLAETRKTELEGLQGQYFDTNRVTLDLSADPELAQHSNSMLTELRNNLPSRVRTAAGAESRVFFDSILQQNGASQGLNEILGAYARAKAQGNEPSCDLAVNAFAKFLGADVDMTPRDEKDWKLLKQDDPAFRAIESAMDKALPHFLNRSHRITTFQQNAPQEARRQFDERVIGIKQNLTKSIFLAPEVAAGRLRANQQDGVALFSQIVSHVPALKQMVEGILDDVSPTMAALSGKLNLPTLTDNNPATVAAHQQEVRRHQEKLSQYMNDIVVGRAAPVVIAVLAAERDAAEARADAASSNTNPGGGRSGGAGGAPDPAIDTQIVKPGM